MHNQRKEERSRCKGGVGFTSQFDLEECVQGFASPRVLQQHRQSTLVRLRAVRKCCRRLLILIHSLFLNHVLISGPESSPHAGSYLLQEPTGSLLL